MYGEIDLELYTISIIKLNNAFDKLNNLQPIKEVKDLLTQAYNDLNEIYLSIVDDINQNEVNLNEIYLFFQNGKQTFPQYIDYLSSINNSELDEIITSLIVLFNNLNKIADAFTNEMVK